MKLHVGEATGILMKTVPYLLLRLLVYGLLGFGAALYLAVVFLMAKLFGGAGAIVFLVGIALLFGLLRLARHYVLYLIKAGHVAVITELVHEGGLPVGVNQVQHGKQVVTSMFKEISVLFVVDRLVAGIIRTFNRTVARIADFLPIPGLESVAGILQSVINFSLTFVDETILSYNLSRKNENVWESAKRGVILYAQNWKPIVTTAAAIALINVLGFVALFLILLIPFGGVAALITNETVKFVLLALAFTLAYGIKLAVFNPLFLIMMILTFNQAIEGQEPDAEWENRLEKASNKFRELKDKAMEHIHSKPDSKPEPQVLTKPESPVTLLESPPAPSAGPEDE